jgi:hypothetical protein
MSIEELTEDHIANSVSAAYDSVTLINELKAKTDFSEEDANTLDRNVEHLRIMLSKEWFAAALTAEQKAELESLI